eukprot:TRINITY_DN2323_c0_g1_i1.p1 TRINITY_DN2323_c0_g1~~TRINITY_DN2323_c0_g1_i1.p1  ORF type:complete len:280 (-),score=64.30 TRINITY_DN2323_c0_g1_i1:261-1100(-)
MAPLDATLAQPCAIASLDSEQDWPCLGLEAGWQMVDKSSEDVVALTAFPAESDSDSETSPSWAAQVAKGACKARVQPMKTLRQSRPSAALVQEKVCELQDDEVSTEDDEQLLNPKLLAREARCRQASKGGSHTLRSKIHCQHAKSSDVTVVLAGEAAPEAVSQVAQVLRQAPVRDIVRMSGGSCKQIKTKEGRQAAIAGAKIYDVTVPMSGQDAGNVDVVFRVVEDGRHGTNSRVRHPKYSAANRHRSHKNGRGCGDLEQNKHVSHEELMEALAMAKLL